MKFPLSNEVRCNCPVCQAPLTEEFVWINGGALRRNDSKYYAAAAKDLMGFLVIGVHDHDGPTTCLDIADEAPVGQFEFCFCSTLCLRAFFDTSVDALEAKLENTTLTE